MAKPTLLALAFIVAGGGMLPSRLSAQPSLPRTGEWLGTNAGFVLFIKEDNTDLRRGPLLTGYLSNRTTRVVLSSPRFDYSDNTFHAEYITRGRTNSLTITYLSGSETNRTAVARWWGKEITFHQR